MINGKKVLAVIPARGGSKRCPRKNIREYRRVPLLMRAIGHVCGSKYIDFTVCSTEDASIRCLAEAWGCFVIDRPAELATDDASNEDVLRHALSVYPHDWVVLLQPTSPLRTADDIDACIERAQMGNGCISVYRGSRETNGAVYVATREWLAEHDFHHMGLMKYVMPDERSLDINTPEDFDR